MKINNNNYDMQKQYLDNYKSKEHLDLKNQRPKAEPSVKVEISSTTKKLISEINKSKDVQFSQKVEGIRKAVLEGSYRVSTEDIANKILQVIGEQKGSEIK